MGEGPKVQNSQIPTDVLSRKMFVEVDPSANEDIDEEKKTALEGNFNKKTLSVVDILKMGQ